MLITILFVAQVCCEWVEISQQHYRKPVRLTHNYPFLSTVDKITEVYNEDSTEINRIYVNRTSSEYNWHQGGVHKKQSTGNIRRVQLADSNVRTDSISNVVRTNELYNVPAKKNERTNEENNKGTIQKVPNIGSVKRVQLENSPVKSPSMKTKPTTDNIYEKKTDGFMNANEKSVLETKKEIHHPDTPAFSRSTERAPIFTTQKHKYDNSTVKDTPLYFTNLPKEDFGKEANLNHDYKNGLPVKNINEFSNIEEAVINTASKDNIAEVSKYGYHQTKITETSTKEELLREHKSENNKLHTNSSNNLSSKNQLNTDADKVKPDKSSPNTKFNTMENVVKIMKIVADTISRNTRRSFNSKMRYLQELKDTLLGNIEDHIDATWPDDNEDTSAGARRHSRAAHADPRGHVEFPSSEGALMTISFLTFAVFLVKLVLQVIHTYKNKAMMIAPLVVAASGRVTGKG